MNYSQWYYEFFALQVEEERRMEEQKELIKANAKILRETLIGVLGLRFRMALEEDAPKTPIDPADVIESFIPLSFLLADGERINMAKDTAAADRAIEVAIKDTVFDERAARLAEDEGDMIPILELTPEQLKERRKKWAQQDYLAQARQLGIVLREEPQVETAPHVELKTVDVTSLE